MQVEADLQRRRDGETPGEALEKALFQVDCSASRGRRRPVRGRGQRHTPQPVSRAHTARTTQHDVRGFRPPGHTVHVW